MIWVAGTQKLVADLDEGMRRIEEYCYPLEDRRSRQVYGEPSSIRKVLIVNREDRPGRVSMILVRYPDPGTARQVASRAAPESKKAASPVQVELVIRAGRDGRRHVADPAQGVKAWARAT